ncbi:hypothetical protein ACIREE_21850 [Streptomyces sp. NPDC102467]
MCGGVHSPAASAGTARVEPRVAVAVAVPPKSMPPVPAAGAVA